MRRLVFVVVLVVLAIAPSVFASEGVHWISLRDGTEKARTEKKPMIVDFFFGKGCPRCESLEKEVYENPSIAKKINDDFIPIRVDLTKKLSPEEEALGNKYEFKHDCLLLFLDYNGDIVKDTAGKRLCFLDKIDPEWFIDYLNMVKASSGK